MPAVTAVGGRHYATGLRLGRRGVSNVKLTDAKEGNAVRWNDAIGRFWILTTAWPAMQNLQRSQLQAVLTEVTAVSNRVVNQLNTLKGLAITDYISKGDEAPATGDMFLKSR